MASNVYYLGPLGGLVALPDRYGDVDASTRRAGGVHESLTGVRTVDHFVAPRRSWSWTWPDVPAPQVPFVQALLLDTVPGPLRLIDPQLPNRLPMNVAAGGSITRSGRSFAATSGIPLGYRSVADLPADPSTLGVAALVRGAVEWVRPAPSGGFCYPLDPAASDRLWKVPLLPGEPVTLSTWVTGTTDTVVAMAWRLYGRDGTSVAAQTSNRTLVGSGWTQFEATITPAVDRVALSPLLLCPSTAIAGSVFSTGWQVGAPDALHAPPLLVDRGPGPVAGSWHNGGGPIVAVGDGAQVHTYPYLHNLALTVVEEP